MYSIKQTMALLLMILSIISIARAEDIVYQEKEIIRNGDFADNLYSAWHDRFCNITSLAAKGEGNGMAMGDLDEPSTYFFQQLTVPSELQSATLRFDWRVVEKSYGDFSPTNLQVAIATSKGFNSATLTADDMEIPPLDILDDLHLEKIETAFDWKEFSATLDPSLITKIQEAHDAGEFIFLLFVQTDSNTGFLRHHFDLSIDNISLKVDGVQHVPEMHGKIAYLEVNDDNNPTAIDILDPNTRTVGTIWTHPDGEFDNYSNLAWKPDATELAFVSDHDFQFSLFNMANIFSIKPDGSGLHQIPNVPTGGNAENGDFPRVTVSGSIKVDATDPLEMYWIIMGIEGTDAGTSFSATNGETVPFIIADVPVLDDPAVFNQSFIMTYSSSNCGGGRGFVFPMAPVINGTVDVGTVTFVVPSCIGILAFDCPHDLAWNREGTKLAFRMSGMWTIDPATTNRFDINELAPPGGGNFSGDLAWSPVDDRYLYTDYSYSHGTELYLAEEGGEPQALVSHSDVEDIAPAWLPDGSGFVYVGKPEDEIGFDYVLYQYNLASGEKQRLTYLRQEVMKHLAISPDGRHILIQMCRGHERSTCNLWMLDRTNPVEVWPVTESGHCIYPDWSRVDVPSPDGGGGDGGGGDDGNETPDDSSSGGGGGGGGCFISSSVR